MDASGGHGISSMIIVSQLILVRVRGLPFGPWITAAAAISRVAIRTEVGTASCYPGHQITIKLRIAPCQATSLVGNSLVT
jgi:hypothetical protein